MNSSRHSKICGDFGEALTLYWLSKNGFECVPVDHTGIDIIARNKKKLMGISVKSRTRGKGNECQTLTIKSSDITSADRACKDFRCVPYFSIVIDAKDSGIIRVYIISKHLLLKLCRGHKNAYWKMNEAARAIYTREKIISFELEADKNSNWATKQII